jgi:hypothetical protein
MDEWWKRHTDIDRGGYEKSDVEDITGSIPLLLDKCVVGDKIDMTVADLRDIYHKALSFAHQIRTKTEGRGWDWQWYVRLIRRSRHY